MSKYVVCKQQVRTWHPTTATFLWLSFSGFSATDGGASSLEAAARDVATSISLPVRALKLVTAAALEASFLIIIPFVSLPQNPNPQHFDLPQYSATMIEYTDYQKVFPPGAQMPYDRKRIHEIEARRKELGGQLFIDRVLKALGISKSQFS